MNTPPDNQQEAINQVYEYAANLLVKEKKTSGEVVDSLVQQGLDHNSASAVVENLEREITAAKK
jgi:translation initiation factor IF-2